MKELTEKYQPEGGYGKFPKEKILLTAIIGIDIEEMTGNEGLGKDIEREVMLATPLLHVFSLLPRRSIHRARLTDRTRRRSWGLGSNVLKKSLKKMCLKERI
ncbi:MAG: hypothetical protein NT178_11655 [Proteobacteria bacterium]|nr:hypothetical protein [Pseudomonadota bacterium]